MHTILKNNSQFWRLLRVPVIVTLAVLVQTSSIDDDQASVPQFKKCSDLGKNRVRLAGHYRAPRPILRAALNWATEKQR